MNVADDLALRRELYGRTSRTRPATELYGDLVTACRGLGELAREWEATGHVPSRDLPDVDRTLAGLQSILVALRAQEGPDAA